MANNSNFGTDDQSFNPEGINATEGVATNPVESVSVASFNDFATDSGAVVVDGADFANPAPQETPAAQTGRDEKPAKPKKPKKELKPEDKRNKAKKLVTVITYLVAVLCLFAGLFVPMFGIGSAAGEKMMVRYLPSILNSLLAPMVKNDSIIPVSGWFLNYTREVSAKIDYIALLYVLYAIMCVVALIMLIPVCVGKKEKRTSARCALTVEIISALILGTYAVLKLFNLFSAGSNAWAHYNLLIALGGVLLAAMVQSVANKGSVGTFKIVFSLLSFVTVLLLTDITVLITGLATPLSNFSNLLKCGETVGFVTINNTLYHGFDGIVFSTIFGNMKTYGALGITSLICLMALSILTLFNVAVDTIGIGTGNKYKKNGKPERNAFSNALAIIRYTLTFVIAIALIVLSIIVKECAPGLYLYIYAVILFVQFILAIVKTARDAKRCRKAERQATEFNEGDVPELAPLFFDDSEPVVEPEVRTVYTDEYVDVPVTIEQPYEQPVQETYAQPEPVVEEEQPVQETMFEEPPVEEDEQLTLPIAPPPAEEERTIVYNYRAVYNGPTDSFMDTLTDDEKIEFVQVFLEKKRGRITGVPEYTIGGDNSDFFPAIFVRINRFRDILSDGLLGNIYKQI